MITTQTPARGRAPSPEAVAISEALKTAVENDLAKKRKLGQYYAWVTVHGTELIGPDAPPVDGNRD